MNGNGPNGWTRLVTQFGIPTVFAAVLLWFVLGKLATTLDAVVGEMREQTRVLQGIQEMMLQRG